MANVFPDLENVSGEAEQYVRHPKFDQAMLAFCRGLADFHSVAISRRAGVVDTVTWAVALLVLYLDEHAPEESNASRLMTICAEGPLAGATAVRNAIALLRQSGMIVRDKAPAVGFAHRLRPAPALIKTMQDNLSVRFAAIEPVIKWPKPADEWARTDGVLSRYIQGNVEPYRRDRYILFRTFPEIRTFIDHHCGYHIFMEILCRLKFSSTDASGTISISEVSNKFAVSRAHVRKLLKAASEQDWLSYEPGGRVSIDMQSLSRYRLWFGHEFTWMRRIAGQL